MNLNTHYIHLDNLESFSSQIYQTTTKTWTPEPQLGCTVDRSMEAELQNVQIQDRTSHLIWGIPGLNFGAPTLSNEQPGPIWEFPGLTCETLEVNCGPPALDCDRPALTCEIPVPTKWPPTWNWGRMAGPCSSGHLQKIRSSEIKKLSMGKPNDSAIK
jgi:hypothetical protein